MISFMCQDAIKTIMYLVMRDQFCASHEDLKNKYILAFLLNNEGKCIVSDFEEHFSNFEFYNAEIFRTLLLRVCDEINALSVESYNYDSSHGACYY